MIEIAGSGFLGFRQQFVSDQPVGVCVLPQIFGGHLLFRIGQMSEQPAVGHIEESCRCTDRATSLRAFLIFPVNAKSSASSSRSSISARPVARSIASWLSRKAFRLPGC